MICKHPSVQSTRTPIYIRPSLSSEAAVLSAAAPEKLKGQRQVKLSSPGRVTAEVRDGSRDAPGVTGFHGGFMISMCGIGYASLL